MQLNGIACVEYIEGQDNFVAVLQDTSAEAIKAIQAGTLEISTDAGNRVKTFYQFGAVESIEENFTTKLFTAKFPRMSGQEATIAALEGTVAALQTTNTQLNAEVKAAIEANNFLEECIVEMAEIIYA